ncbi:MAG: ParB/RepB/Spo0J family partition protein [Synergistaceae bacterium]|nr:ParB/RepB/Spo0J family partition protein [Synergistota bacterium]NLM70509.1 ParB/RepB/Spo0J family partition protein [Synergistaceae bacterium]
MAKERALGKGLASLLPPSESAEKRTGLLMLKTEEIGQNPHQPRRSVDEKLMEELAASIKAYGIIQPIVVRKDDEGNYVLVAGARRLEAAKRAGLGEIPARLIEANEHETREMSLIENIQREELSSLDAAHAINELIIKYSLTHEEIAKNIGWSRAKLTNKLRLLKLPRKICTILEAGMLTEGHCRALLGIGDEETMILVAQKAATYGYTVRQVEEIVKKANADPNLKLKGHTRRKEPSILTQAAKEFARTKGFGVKLTERANGVKLQLDGIELNMAEDILRFIEENAEKYFPGNNPDA